MAFKYIKLDATDPSYTAILARLKAEWDSTPPSPGERRGEFSVNENNAGTERDPVVTEAWAKIDDASTAPEATNTATRGSQHRTRCLADVTSPTWRPAPGEERSRGRP